MIPVLLPAATDVAVTINVTLGVLWPVLITVKVGTEEVDIDCGLGGVEEGASSVIDSEPGPTLIAALDGSITVVESNGTETTSSVYVEVLVTELDKAVPVDSI